MGNEADCELVRQVLQLCGGIEPDDLSSIFFAGLDLLKKEIEKRQSVYSESRRRARRARRPGARVVPAAVRRQVWLRDGARCAFVGVNGHRCEARWGIDCDLIVPLARGGAPTVENVRLLCRVHSAFEAERNARGTA